MTDSCDIAEYEYPEINKLILSELRKIPEIVLCTPILDNAPNEVRIAEQAIHETLKVIGMHCELIHHGTEAVIVLEHEGPDIQYQHVSCTTEVKNLASQYFDMVNG